jgi:hypothetical protein
MTIDKITVNLYTCCKCNYQWTSWNGNQRAEEPIPKNCPKCRNVRWNQRYLDEELALVNRLQDELYETNLIRKSNDKIELEGNEFLRTKPRTIYPYDYDFISYDFLNEILPQPELFELRQVLAIPKEDIEARHEYMLSVIKDRIDNAEKYELEWFSKYSQYGNSRRKIGFDFNIVWESRNYRPSRRRIMSRSTECKHKPIPEIENKLYPDYDHGSYQRMYIELKEED